MADDSSKQNDTANKTIYTDPDELKKVEAQILVYDGEKWLEISNTRTTNVINDKVDSVADAVAQAQQGIAQAEDDAQNAVTTAENALTQAGFANDTAQTAQQTASSLQPDVAQAKSDSAAALQDAQNAFSQSQTNSTDISGISADLNSTKSDLADTKTSLQSVSAQAVQNGKDINTTNSTVSGMQTDLANTKGDVTELQTTATGLRTDVTNAQGDISSVQQEADATKTSLTNTQGDVSSLQQTASSLSSQIGTTNTNVTNLGKTVTTQGTQISQNTSDIALKADKTTVNSLSGTVSSQGTEISQNTSDIKLKASQTDVNTLTGRVSSAESNIQQNADEISTKVTASDVSSMLTPYATQSWTTTQINQTASSITSTVTNLQTQVDNSAVGTNLLIGTSSILQVVPDITNIYGGGLIHPFTSSEIETLVSNEVTVRVYIKNTSSVPVRLSIFTGNSFLWGNFIQAGQEGFSTWSGQMPSTFGVADISIRTGNQTDSATGVQYRSLKAELGSVATDWNLNPSENATVTSVSQVKQEADSISQTVTNNKSSSDAQFSTVNQTINGITSTVANKADNSTVTQLSTLLNSKVNSSDYNSEITQLASDINLRVQTSQLISQINQQAGGNTLIQVASGKGKLYLDASSVVFGGTAYITDAMIANVSADKIDAGTIKGIEIVGSDYYAGTPYTSTTDGTFYPIQMNDLGFIEKKESNTFVRDTNDMSWKGTGNVGTQYSDVTTFDASSFTTGQVFDIISNINIASAKVLATGTVTAVLADGTTMNIPAQKLMYGQHTYNFRGTWNSAWNSQTGIKLLFTGVGTDVTITVGMAQFMLNENDSSTTNVFSKDRLQITPDGGLIQYTEEASDTNNDTSYVELQGASLNLYSGNMGTHQSTPTVDEYLTRINGQGISFFGNAGYADEATNSRINFYGAASYQDVVNGVADPDGVIMSAWGNVRGFKDSGAWAVEDYTGTRRLEIGLKNDNGFSITSRGAVNITAAAGYQANINATVNVAYALNVNSTINGFRIANNYITTAGYGLWVNSSGGVGGNATVHAKGFSNTSILSLKTNITEIDTSDALSQILGTKQYHYQFKDDIKNLGADKAKTYTSFIIDDVNTTPEYTEPDEFLADDKKGRDDGAQLAYAVAAIQELYKRIEALQNQVASLSK